MAKKKKKLQKSDRNVAKAEPFVIKSPAWCTYVCLAVAVACIIGLICMWSQKEDFVKLVEDGDIVGWTLLLSLIMAAALVGLYICLYEKMTYLDGVYGYYKAFKRNQFARVEEIKKVELITKITWGTRGMTTSYRVIFYGLTGEALISFFDDGTVFKDERLKKSLRTNGIQYMTKTMEKHSI